MGRVGLAEFLRDTDDVNVWGGAEQIRIAADFFGCTYVVHGNAFSVPYGSQGPVWHLLYDGEHYDFWQESQTSGQSGEHDVGHNENEDQESGTAVWEHPWGIVSGGDPPEEPCGECTDWDTSRVGDAGVMKGSQSGNRCPRRLGGHRQLNVVTFNVGGSRKLLQEAYEFECEILLIQEHRCSSSDCETQRILAKARGWNSVWQPAKIGRQSREGGVSVCVREKYTIFCGKGQYNHRWMRAVVPWTRSRNLHLVSFYGFHSGHVNALEDNIRLLGLLQEEKAALGRVPFVAGGDWNLRPHELGPLFEMGFRVVASGQATQIFGKELDYFLVNADLPVNCARTFGEELWLGDHRPVCLKLDTVNRPPEGWVWQPVRRFEIDGETVRAHKDDYVPALEAGSLEHVYAQWCDNMHHWLGSTLGNAHGLEGPWRGMAPRMVRSSRGAPQGITGVATSGEGRRLGLELGRLRRLLHLPVRPANPQQLGERLSLLAKLGMEKAGFSEIVCRKLDLELRLKRVDSCLRRQRITGWREFVRDSRSRPRKLYDWIKRVSVKLGSAGLHWDLPEPPGDVSVRVERAFPWDRTFGPRKS